MRDQRTRNVYISIRHVVVMLIFVLKLTNATLCEYGLDAGDDNVTYDSWNNGSSRVDLDVNIPLFGCGSITHLWVNSFGFISVNSSTNSSLSNILNNVLIAPFFSPSQPGASGAVYVRQTQTDKRLFQLVTRDVFLFEGGQRPTFTPTYALLVTWSKVASPDDATKVNTFQLVLATDTRKTYAFYHYDEFQWTSASGRYAVAGVHAVGDGTETCSWFLEGSGTSKVFRLVSAMKILGSPGRHILDLTNPIKCTDDFASTCGNFTRKHRGILTPMFELDCSGESLEYNFYLKFTCKPGLSIARDITSQKFNCVYDSDFYGYDWDVVNAPQCIDLEATRQFQGSVEITEVNGEKISHSNTDSLKELAPEAVKRLLENVEITDGVVGIDNIKLVTRNINGTDTTIAVLNFTTYFPPYTNKKLTAPTFEKKLVDELTNNSEVNLLTFENSSVHIIETTSKCLQACLCRNQRARELCATGVDRADLQPDACCAGCNGGRAYASAIKACCNNAKIYDPTISICCNGSIKKGNQCTT